jgi:signal transduction histidine kinase
MAEKAELEKQVKIRTQSLNDKNLVLEKQKEELNENNILLVKQKQQIEKQSEELSLVAENLAKINDELSHANETKDKLFSIIAHDLINPFNAILGFSNELTENYSKWEEYQRIKFLEYINESSNKAFDLMQNLLQWARSQNGRIEFDPENMNVSETITNAIKEVSTFAQKKSIQVESKLNDKNLSVSFDKIMINLILRNLLMNAIKFSNNNSKIQIDAILIEKGMVQFSVKDFGVGMDPDYATSIFSIDSKVEASVGTSGEKGVGLGLSLCKDFVTSNGGEIWVESKPGKGSTFFFTIPGENNL